MILLLYTCTYVPFSIAFFDDEVTEHIITKAVDTAADTLFAIDIVITFISAYEVPGGLPEVRLKMIVRQYLTGWFLIDLVATVPTDLFNE